MLNDLRLVLAEGNLNAQCHRHTVHVCIKLVTFNLAIFENLPNHQITKFHQKVSPYKVATSLLQSLSLSSKWQNSIQYIHLFKAVTSLSLPMFFSSCVTIICVWTEFLTFQVLFLACYFPHCYCCYCICTPPGIGGQMTGRDWFHVETLFKHNLIKIIRHCPGRHPACYFNS